MTLESNISFSLSSANNVAEGVSYLIYDRQTITLTIEQGYKSCSSLKTATNLDDGHISCVDELTKEITQLMSSLNQYTITPEIAQQIQQDSNQDVTLSYNHTVVINANITWNSDQTLLIQSTHSINIGENVVIENRGLGTLKLFPGVGGINPRSTVNFDESATMRSPKEGKIKIFYNPIGTTDLHKYFNPYNYEAFCDDCDVDAFMLINNFDDLQSMTLYPSGNYALSTDINGLNRNFQPIANMSYPFSGDFDGNNFNLYNLKFHKANFGGIFGVISGTKNYYTIISNLNLYAITGVGEHNIGLLAGHSEHAIFNSLRFGLENSIECQSYCGSITGSGIDVQIINTFMEQTPEFSNENTGILAGALIDSRISNSICTIDSFLCVGSNFEVAENE